MGGTLLGKQISSPNEDRSLSSVMISYPNPNWRGCVFLVVSCHRGFEEFTLIEAWKAAEDAKLRI